MPSPLDTEWDQIPPQLRERLMLNKEGYEAMQRSMRERDARTPPAGSQAPDFELKRLSAEGDLTEQTLMLSEMRGRPVALVFGSYT